MKYSAQLLDEIGVLNQQITLLKEEIARLRHEGPDAPGTEEAIAGHKETLAKLQALRDGKWRLRGSVIRSEKEIAVRERKRKREAGLRKVKTGEKKRKPKT